MSDFIKKLVAKAANDLENNFLTAVREVKLTPVDQEKSPGVYCKAEVHFPLGYYKNTPEKQINHKKDMFRLIEETVNKLMDQAIHQFPDLYAGDEFVKMFLHDAEQTVRKIAFNDPIYQPYLHPLEQYRQLLDSEPDKLHCKLWFHLVFKVMNSKELIPETSVDQPVVFVVGITDSIVSGETDRIKFTPPIESMPYTK